jgi:hypothetical protein
MTDGVEVSSGAPAEGRVRGDVASLRARADVFPLPESVVERPRLLRAAQTETVPFEAVVADRLEVKPDSAPKLVAEYRRFMVLQALAGEALMPSPMIDEVWTLHRADPSSYDAFCRDALRCAVVRGPEPPRHQVLRRYARTRALYREVFGAAPPRACWPPRLGGWVAIAAAVVCVVVVLTFAYVVNEVFDVAQPLGIILTVGVFVGLFAAYAKVFGIQKGEVSGGV